MKGKQLQAEPVLVIDGKRTDVTEHYPMLQSKQGQILSREAAIKKAVTLGISEDEARAAMTGSDLLESLLPAQKNDFLSILRSRTKI